MDKLHCEACGSNELTKKGDYLICDYCHTKYTAKKEPVIANPAKSSLVNISIQTSAPTADKPAPERKVLKKTASFGKKVLAIPLLLLGAFCLLGTIAFLQGGDLYGIIIFGWLAALSLNYSYSLSSGKKFLLTKQFSGWQLALISLVIFIALLVMV